MPVSLKLANMYHNVSVTHFHNHTQIFASFKPTSLLYHATEIVHLHDFISVLTVGSAINDPIQHSIV